MNKTPKKPVAPTTTAARRPPTECVARQQEARGESKQREDALGGNTSEIINVGGRSNEGLLIVTA